MRGVILVNASSGNGRGPGPDDVARVFHRHRVERCEPSDLTTRFEAVLEEQPDFVGVAGGDGSVNAAVAALVRGPRVPLLIVPLGTRTHFARQLGIESLDAARQALAKERSRRVSVGEVRGRHFVNNASIGMYPMLVKRRQAHARRVPRAVANVMAAWDLLRRGRRIEVQLGSQTHPAWMLFVGNGRYGDHMFDLTDRSGLHESVLDVRLVRAGGRFSRLRVVGSLVCGSLSNRRLVHRHVVATADFNVAVRRVEVAYDGEVELMESHLTFTSHPGALTVFTNAPG